MAARFKEIKSADYPSTSARDLIDFLSNALSEIEKKITIVDSVNELVIAQRLLEFYGSLFQFFDGANIERTPRALVKTIEFLTYKISPDATVLPSPIHEYNYSIVEIGKPILQAAKHFVPDIQNAFPFKGPINCISFPHVERDNILMHAVLGHEIGHPIADEFLSAEEENEPFKVKQGEIAETIRQLVNQHAPKDPLFAFKQQQESLKYVLEIRRRALEEIISDCVSIILYGPSAMFAMYELLSNDLDSPPQGSRFYPPSRMRLRYIFQIMETKGYVDAIMSLDEPETVDQCIEPTKEFVTYFKSIIEAQDDFDELAKDPLRKLSFDWVALSMKEAIKFLYKKLPTVDFDAGQISAHIPELLKRLQLGITPNEIGDFSNIQAVDWRSSMLAGWMYNIGGISIPYDLNVTVNAQHYEIINRLTMKSIEYALLVEAYRDGTSSKVEA